MCKFKESCFQKSVVGWLKESGCTDLRLCMSPGFDVISSSNICYLTNVTVHKLSVVTPLSWQIFHKVIV